MKPNNPHYEKFSLCREMLETADVIRNHDTGRLKEWARLKGAKKFLLTGEGSSRLFPAKHAIYKSLINGSARRLFTEGATQALEYKLDDHVVIGVSNSGKTKEVVRLFMKLKDEGHEQLCTIVANDGTPLPELAGLAHILACGKEDAVAATKSVVEQALTYDTIFRILDDRDAVDTKHLAFLVENVLSLDIDPEFPSRMAGAGTIYFAGRNNGVAEELTLKTNEITRKRSDYLEGTYAVHGIEEIMQPEDVVIAIDPFPDEEAKMQECLVQGVGMKVIAIASRETSFPTIRLPEAGELNTYLQLAAGWNLLVEAGFQLGVNLDKPQRARKVGNAFGG